MKFGDTEVKIYYVSHTERQQKIDRIQYIDRNMDKWYYQYWNEISIGERVKLRSRRYRQKKHLRLRIGI